MHKCHLTVGIFLFRAEREGDAFFLQAYGTMTLLVAVQGLCRDIFLEEKHLFFCKRQFLVQLKE